MALVHIWTNRTENPSKMHFCAQVEKYLVCEKFRLTWSLRFNIFRTSPCSDNISSCSSWPKGQFTSNVVCQLSTNNSKKCGSRPENCQSSTAICRPAEKSLIAAKSLLEKQFWGLTCSALSDSIQLRRILSHLWDSCIPLFHRAAALHYRQYLALVSNGPGLVLNTALVIVLHIKLNLTKWAYCEHILWQGFLVIMPNTLGRMLFYEISLNANVG